GAVRRPPRAHGRSSLARSGEPRHLPRPRRQAEQLGPADAPAARRQRPAPARPRSAGAPARGRADDRARRDAVRALPALPQARSGLEQRPERVPGVLEARLDTQVVVLVLDRDRAVVADIPERADEPPPVDLAATGHAAVLPAPAGREDRAPVQLVPADLRV